MPKLLALDCDGTLTNAKKEITPRTRAALIRLQEQGVKLVLASGRPPCGIDPMAQALELDRFGGYIISYAGCQLASGKGRILESETIPSFLIPKILSVAKAFRLSPVTYHNDCLLSERADSPYQKIEQTVNHMELRVVDSMEDALSFPVPKFLLMEERSCLAKVETEVRRALPECSVYGSDFVFLEVMPKGVDKAFMLGKLLRRLGMAREDLVACGDGANDCSMLRYAGIGVAMGNASPAVQAQADFVTASNEEEGVVQAIQKFFSA